MDYMTAFDTAFTNTTRWQTAQAKLKHLWMKDDNLDTYISTFKHLAQDAGYDLTAMGMVDLFALGLREMLFNVCMYRQMQPESFNDWVTATKEELIKRTRRYAMQESTYQSHPYHGKSYQAANGCQCYVHPNNRVIPMDIDPPIHTYIWCASTEADKQQLREQGKCFRCKAFGHMAQECPLKPRQQAPSTYGQQPSTYGQWPQTGQLKRKPFSQSHPKQGFRKSNKPKTSSYTPWACAAYIEEVEEGEDDKVSDAPTSRDSKVPNLAACTARLSEDQCEQWIEEMNAMGINF
jgi:hypothetical protein